MKKNFTSILTVLMLLLCCHFQKANAAERVFELRGTITTSDIGGFPVGTPFQVTLRYDDAAAPVFSHPVFADYTSFSFTLSVGGTVFNSDPAAHSLQIQNGNVDRVSFRSNPTCFDLYVMTLNQDAATIFNSTNLPSVLSILDFELAYISYETNSCDPLSTRWDGIITSITSCTNNPVVTTNSDAGPGSLRQAILDACPGSTITFDPSLNGQTITLASTLPVIDKNLTISGPGANLLSISGNDAVQIFNINTPTVTISGLTMANGNNQGDYGGGAIYVGGTGDLTVSNSTFLNNNSSKDGGAIFIFSSATTQLLTVTGCTFSGNTASTVNVGIPRYGGAIYSGAMCNISNSTFTGNSADFNGGAILLARSGSITNCTITGNAVSFPNSGNKGGGVFAYCCNNFTISNSIIAGNTSAGTDPDIMGVFSTTNNNIIGIADASLSGFTNGTNGNQVGTLANPVNPLLAPLAYYGGTTQTMPLLPGSPAINAGTDINAAATDQRGLTRYQQTDIGAFESQGLNMVVLGGDNQSAATGTAFASPLIVLVNSNNNEPVDGGIVTFTAPAAGASITSTAFTSTISGNMAYSGTVTANSIAGGPYNVTASTSGASVSYALTNTVFCVTDPVVTNNANDGPGSLRQAIYDACPGSTITFDMTQVTSPISLSTGQLNIDKSLTIQGPGANLLTVQNTAAPGPISRVFNAEVPFQISGVVFNISGITMSGGNTPNGGGGAIINDNVLLNITNSTISGNAAYIGGGIYSRSPLTMTGCTIANNSSIQMSGGIHSNSSATLINCTISGNSTNGYAGGVHASDGSLHMTNCTITANSAQSSGGIEIYSLISGTAYAKNSIIAGNSADENPDIRDRLPNLISLGNNLIGIPYDGADNWIASDQIGTLNAALDPLLGPLAYNGGSTMTHALLPGSPAINAGTDTDAPVTDQRGFARAGVTDIGAFELQTLPTITTITPIANTSCFGDGLILTVSVTSNGNPVSQGTLNISDGVNTIVANGTLNANGQFTFGYNTLPVGSYTFTATYQPVAGFSGSSASVQHTVLPLPNVSVTPLAQTICSGSAMNTIALTSDLTGTEFIWDRDNGDAASGLVTGIASIGSGNISGSLTNTSANDVTVSFRIVPAKGGCIGTPVIATVLVKAALAITQVNVTQPACTITTGQIVVNATAGSTLEYSINGGNSWSGSNTFSSLVPGTYNISVRLQNSPACIVNYSGPVILVAATNCCTITCPANITVNSKSNACGAYVNYPAATVTGSCGAGALTYSHTCNSWFPVGTTTVTVRSASGASCSFTITVKDVQKPVISCSPNISTTTTGCSKVVNFTSAASDNCPGVIVTSSPASGTAFPTGTTTVTVTAKDASNNISTATFTVTVKESVKPVITCRANISVNAAAGLCNAIVNTGTPTATDNCPVVTVTGTRSDSKALTAAYPVGNTTITWKATDRSGNYVTCQQKITVKDIQAPVISNASASPSVLWPADRNMKTITINYTSTDNCQLDCSANCVLSVTSNEPSSGAFSGDIANDWQIINNRTVKLRAERKPSGTGRIYTVKITCTDAHGNVSTKNVTVTVPLSSPGARGIEAEPEFTKAIEENEQLTVQVSPNPSAYYFNLTVKSSAVSPVSVNVVDVAGRKVKRLKTTANTISRFGDDLIPGTYFVEVIQGTEKKVIKIIKL